MMQDIFEVGPRTIFWCVP